MCFIILTIVSLQFSSSYPYWYEWEQVLLPDEHWYWYENYAENNYSDSIEQIKYLDVLTDT